MAGIKPLPLTEFYRSLHARGASTTTLAADLGVSGGAVRRLLVGLRRRGPLWKRLHELLTDKEREQLQHVEQCSAWNAKRAARRPIWTAEKAAQLSNVASQPRDEDGNDKQNTDTQSR